VTRFSPLFLLSAAAVPAFASDDPLVVERYLHPPKEVMDAVLAPWHLNVSLGNLSPDRTRFLIVERDGMPSLAALARPSYNLGGLQIDPAANRHRRLSTRVTNSGFRIYSLADKRETRVATPRGAVVSDFGWSPDGGRVSFLAHYDGATYLYTADARTGRTRRLTDRPLLATLSTGTEWTSGGREIATVLLPSNRGPEPPTSVVPDTPRVRMSTGRPIRIRVYASLLDNPRDQQLLEYSVTGQLAAVDVNTGRIRPIGKPAMISSFSPSPDGKFFRVTTMEKPFSYVVPQSSFGTRETIWDDQGDVKAQIARRQLRLGASGNEEEPALLDEQDAEQRTQAQTTGRRMLSWRPDGAGLSYLQVAPAPNAKDEEESDEPVRGRRKDRVMLWKAPFGPRDIETVYESDAPIRNVRYAEDGRTIFLNLTEGDKEQIVMVHLDDKKPKTIVEWKPSDFYGNPGDLVMKPGSDAGRVVRMSSDGRFVYLSGTQYFKDPRKEAPRPFVDRVAVETGEKERLFESDAERFETATLLDDDMLEYVVTRQSPTEVPNSFLVDRKAKTETAITSNRDFLPDITQAPTEEIEVTRPDGIKFRVRVTFPRHHVPGMTRLPAFFWFYPREFVDQAAYDRTLRNHNKNLFRSVGPQSKTIFTRLGYALVEPDTPIIGPSDRKNDAYVPQLRNNLYAVIEELDRRGWVDRRRLALGGHSYGGFSTANAMIHTPFFRAGIAGAGNYNRLLTPFGFQGEQRQLWDGREVYLGLSPILHAEQLTGALLLYHGMEDQNVGTAPINSERMFAALNALGKPSALYMYPYEDHGQVAQETVLDMWARWVAWLEKYLKE
jgi:dipeptidyl aminopeptidase/acylaminoacyl peptidase